MSRLLETVPEFYARFLPLELFAKDVPETKATCANCAMCASSGGDAVSPFDGGADRFFSPDTKCCTYHPRMPNYLVGALLSDEAPELAEGRRRIEARIDARIGTSPQWLKPPAKYTLLYGNQKRAFGRAKSLLCPFYETDGGRCTVWKYRESVCSTYFCKYDEGEDGFRFWMSLKEYLTLLEVQLSRYALSGLFPEFVLDRRDRTDVAAGRLGPSEMDEGPPSDADYAALWGRWKGRERELYRACFERVSALTRADVERLLGFDGEIERSVVERALGRVESRELPEVLMLNPEATVKWLPDGSIALGAYSENDALALPGAAWDLLTAFRGDAPVAQVRERLRTERQADLGDEVLRVLYRHRILTTPKAAGAR